MKKILLILIAFLTLSVASDRAFGQVNGEAEFTSCSAVTSTGSCTSGRAAKLVPRQTYTVIVTGAPSAVSVDIEGSLDDVEFFVLDTSTTTTREMRHIVNRGVHYIRGNVTTLTGGSSPTVTVKISAGG